MRGERRSRGRSRSLPNPSPISSRESHCVFGGGQGKSPFVVADRKPRLGCVGRPSWTRRFCGQKVGGQNGRAQSFVSKDPRSTGSPVRMASDVILCRRSPIISCASCNQFSHRGSQQPMMRTCGVSFGSCISHGGLGLRSAVRGRIIAYSASWRHTPKNP